jgi:hypothetical protein
MQSECPLWHSPSVDKLTGADHSSQGRLDRFERCFPLAGLPRPASSVEENLPTCGLKSEAWMPRLNPRLIPGIHPSRGQFLGNQQIDGCIVKER